MTRARREVRSQRVRREIVGGWLRGAIVISIVGCCAGVVVDDAGEGEVLLEEGLVVEKAEEVEERSAGDRFVEAPRVWMTDQAETR